MLRCKAFPNYWNYYYLNEGDTHIKLERKVGGQTTYKLIMRFETYADALAYFEEYCGA